MTQRPATPWFQIIKTYCDNEWKYINTYQNFSAAGIGTNKAQFNSLLCCILESVSIAKKQSLVLCITSHVRHLYRAGSTLLQRLLTSLLYVPGKLGVIAQAEYSSGRLPHDTDYRERRWNY